MAEYIVSDTNLQAVANAIRTKGGTSGQLAFPSGFVSAIEAIPSGGGGSSPDPTKPVKFIDYDGTLLYSYTAAELQALSALPANPSHAGLTAQGWNWTLAEAKAQLTAMPDAGLTVGQNYITSDGKTRLYCHFETGRLAPYLGICPKGTVTVDWGDGSSTDTLTGTSESTVQNVQHTYTAAGDYVITLTPEGETTTFAFYGTTSAYSYILRTGTSNTLTKTASNIYRNAIQKIELGTSAKIKDCAFYSCFGLTSITIPSDVESIGGYAFYCCYSLASLTIPSGVASLGSSALQYCYSLSSVSIPSSVTSIANSAFKYCNNLDAITIPSGVTSIANSVFDSDYGLASVVMPSGLTSIGSSAFMNCASFAIITIPSGVASIENTTFSGCQGAAEYHMKRTTAPTLSNVNAFTGIPSDCIIYVPYSADHSVLENYKTASNWSNFASQIQEEPA